MFQRMRGAISIEVDGVDMTTVSNIEVKLYTHKEGVMTHTITKL